MRSRMKEMHETKEPAAEPRPWRTSRILLPIVLLSVLLVQGCFPPKFSPCDDFSVTVGAGQCVEVEQLRVDFEGNIIQGGDCDIAEDCFVYTCPNIGPTGPFQPQPLIVEGAPGIYARSEWTGPGFAFNDFICASDNSPRYADPVPPSAYEKSFVAVSQLILNLVRHVGQGTVFVETLFGVSATADPSNLRLGQPTQLEAIVGAAVGAVAFEWKIKGQAVTLGTERTLAVSPTTDTVYTVTGTDADGTQQTAEVGVTVIDYFVTVSANPDTILPRQTSQLLADVTGGTPPYDYSWAPADGLAPGDETAPNPVVGPSADTTYRVTVTDSTAGTPRITTGEVTVVVSPPPDLQIRKISQPQSLRVGDAFRYSLTVENLGTGGATGVVVTDTLPPQVRLDALPLGCNAVDNTVVCGLPDLGPGEQTRLLIDATVLLGVSGPIVNTARVESNEVDLDPANNVASFSSNVCPAAGVPCADLEITKTGAPEVVGIGETVSYGLGVRNLGPDDATDVIVTDQLAPGATFDPGNSSLECSDSGGGLVTCDIAVLPRQFKSLTIAATVNPGAPGTIINTARIQANETDPFPANNVATTGTGVVTSGTAELSIAGIETVDGTTGVDVDVVGVGDTIQFGIQYENKGPDVAHDVVITDILPPGFGFLPIFSPECTETDGTVSCPRTFVNAAPGVILRQLFRAIVTTAAPDGTLLNTASIRAAETDPFPVTNVATSPIIVCKTPCADLQLTKDVFLPSVPAGGQQLYQFGIVNNGPFEATGVTLLDTLPLDVTFFNAGGCTALGRAVTCDLGTIPDGGFRGISMTVFVNAGASGTIVNTGTLISDVRDPVLENNTDSASMDVVP